MNRFRVKFGMSLILTAVIITAPSLASAERDDWEYWGEYSFKYKITDDLTFKVTPKMQVRDDFSNPYYWESAHGLAYKINKTFDVGVYHLFAEEDRTDTNKRESRLRVEANVHYRFKGMKFSDRSRYEYRTFNIGKSKDRYRNRISLTFSPVDVFGHEITPYVSNEFFYDLDLDKYNQNRAAIGFSKKLNDWLKAGMYYMTKSSKSSSGHWNETHIIGTKFDVSLGGK